MNCANIFDWLKHINTHKTSSDKFSEKDWDVFNSYMIHRFLSMNPEHIEVVNYVQEFPPQEKVMIYNIYKEFIPENKRWNKYIKSSTKQPNENLLNQLKEYFKVSSREILDYMKILEKQDIIHILSKMGLEDKEIKTLLK